MGGYAIRKTQFALIDISQKVIYNDIESEITIFRSIGAQGKNYPVKLPDSKEHTKLAEGQQIKGKVFAGKGTNIEIRDRFRLESENGIPASEWKKLSGNGYIIYRGKKQKVELHWYEARNKIIEMKVKRWF